MGWSTKKKSESKKKKTLIAWSQPASPRTLPTLLTYQKKSFKLASLSGSSISFEVTQKVGVATNSVDMNGWVSTAKMSHRTQPRYFENMKQERARLSTSRLRCGSYIVGYEAVLDEVGNC